MDYCVCVFTFCPFAEQKQMKHMNEQRPRADCPLYHLYLLALANRDRCDSTWTQTIVCGVNVLLMSAVASRVWAALQSQY